MKRVDGQIKNADNNICENISRASKTDSNFFSQNILSQSRVLVEHVALKVYIASLGEVDIDDTLDNIRKAIIYVKSRSDTRFIGKFHKRLQISKSHYTDNEDSSGRLMLGYYKYFLQLKQFMKETFDIEILDGIDKFPIDTDPNLTAYYQKIVNAIDGSSSIAEDKRYNDRYYVRKTKPFFVGGKIYYEVTFTIANDYASKFDRVIAFSQQEVLQNYAVRLTIKNSSIDILNKRMPILIISRWQVAIRPCEFDRFADIFGGHEKFNDRTTEAKNLMKFLTLNNMDLTELVTSTDSFYKNAKSQILLATKTTRFFNLLDISRELIIKNKSGSNVLRYLLFIMNNKVMKQQYYWQEPCNKLSELYLKYGCIPFDQMPFVSSLINHNPKIIDLFDCIEMSGREHELLARFIRNNTENNNMLYTPRTDLDGFGNIDALIKKYNSLLYYKHASRRLEEYNGYIFIKEYEDDAHFIVNRLCKLSKSGLTNYQSSVEAWLKSTSYTIDDEKKKEALKKIFNNSEVGLIYGAAGTGKSTMINHIAQFFSDKDIVYLANTNPAVENLRRKVSLAKKSAMTIAKFLSNKNNDIRYDIIVIDECSTVSNRDMRAILEKAEFKLIVLVGDIFQIESIIFGNWFSIIKSFIPQTAVFELTSPYRSSNKYLLDLWDKVRNLDDSILEYLVRGNYSAKLDNTIFEHSNSDEIILCLNYDGLYGINNINRFLQENNPNPAVRWSAHTYKVGDPILFNESERFVPVIYNNLKGRINHIETYSDKICFDIEVDKIINELDAEWQDFELLPNVSNNKSTIRFFVDKLPSTDEDDSSSLKSIVPFQVAYSVSIHKAQGLEYDYVKVVVADEVDELITHGIFYTAVTRAKNSLKIYWTPEVEKKVLENLKLKDNKRDVALLKSKYCIN